MLNKRRTGACVTTGASVAKAESTDGEDAGVHTGSVACAAGAGQEA